MKTATHNKSTEPGDRDWSSTSPHTTGSKEKKGPPPFLLPPTGSQGSGTDPRKSINKPPACNSI